MIANNSLNAFNELLAIANEIGADETAYKK